MIWQVAGAVGVAGRRGRCEGGRRRDGLPAAVELGLHEQRLLAGARVFAEVYFIAIRRQFIAFAPVDAVVETIPPHRAEQRRLGDALRRAPVLRHLLVLQQPVRRVGAV